MPEPYAVRRVYEISRELKVPTTELIEFLTSNGHDVSRNAMHPVSEQMFIAILFRYDRLRFNNYLTERGIAGEDLKRMAALLDAQIRKYPQPAPAPKPMPLPERVTAQTPLVKTAQTPPVKTAQTPPVKAAPPPPKPVLAKPIRPPVAHEEPTNFRIIINRRPVSPFAQTSPEPKSIPTSPLVLDLIQRLLELPYDRKQAIVEELRKAV